MTPHLDPVLAMRARMVRKRVQLWVPSPFTAPPRDGHGSTPLTLTDVEVLDDPLNPAWPEIPPLWEPCL